MKQTVCGTHSYHNVRVFPFLYRNRLVAERANRNSYILQEEIAEHQYRWGHLALQTEHNRAGTTDDDVVEAHGHGYESVCSEVEHFT